MLGQTYETFFDSNDGGRDGAFRGSWTPQKGESLSGSFTVQCKFTASPDKHLGLADLSEEIQKAERLAAQGLAENYLLFANHKLTGMAEERITERFHGISGLKGFRVFGKERISQFIRESRRLRMLVPGVYGLGDLSQILDERAAAIVDFPQAGSPRRSTKP